MARPKKETIDYFSHDANASTGRTLTIIYNHYGHEGISAWWQLLEIISSTRNHILDTRNPEDFEYLAAKMRFSPERLKVILNKLAALEAIDSKLYGSGYIWSQNFIDRVSTVYRNRDQEAPLKPVVSINGNPITLPETPVPTPDNPQTKERKETKEKKLKNTQKFGEALNVFLTLAEYEKLKDKFGQADADIRIESLSLGIASKGYEYASHYHTVLSWARRDQQEGKGNGAHQQRSTKKLPTQYTKPAYDPRLDSITETAD